MKFGFIDIALFAGLGVSAYLGYRGGMVKKVFNLLALIGAIVLATQMMQPVGTFLIDVMMFSAPFAFVLAFALVVVAIMIATIVMYRRFGKEAVSKSTSQGAGIVLGLFEGAMVMSLLLLMLKVYDVPREGTRTSSLLYRPLVTLAPRTFDLMRPYLPWAGDFREELSRVFEKHELFERLPDVDSSL